MGIYKSYISYADGSKKLVDNNVIQQPKSPELHPPVSVPAINLSKLKEPIMEQSPIVDRDSPIIKKIGRPRGKKDAQPRKVASVSASTKPIQRVPVTITIDPMHSIEVPVTLRLIIHVEVDKA